MEENKKLIIAAMVILFGSNAGSFINAINPNVRNDPFTGTRGNGLENRIDALELEVSACKDRNANHRTVQARELSKLQANVINNRFLIERCMDITGN